MTKYLYLFILSVFVIGGLFFYDNARFNDGLLHVVVCDVGQGDGMYIRTPEGSDVLIDGGPDDSILGCLSDHMPFWDRTIEVIILTHPDADHITGAVNVIQRYSVINLFTQANPGSTLIYKRFLKALSDKNIKQTFVSVGDKIEFGDKTSLSVIWPDSTIPVSNPRGKTLALNEYSVITRLEYGNFSALLAGDAGVRVMDEIATRVGDVDVLKVPHHGSKTGMSELFLNEIHPELALISVGAKNRYGHPTTQALDLLKNNSTKVLRTDTNGEVEIVSNGNGYSLLVD